MVLFVLSKLTLLQTKMPSILDSATNMLLGKIGEDLPVTDEFSEVVNLNTIQHNFPFFDIIAKKNDEIYVFSVKARKRNGGNGKLNPCYHLHHGSDVIARKFKKAADLLAKMGHDVAKIHYCFMVVPIEENTRCSYYWGELKDIELDFTPENVVAGRIKFLGIKVTNKHLATYNVYGHHDWATIVSKHFA